MLQYYFHIFFYLLRPLDVVCSGEIVFGAMTGDGRDFVIIVIFLLIAYKCTTT